MTRVVLGSSLVGLVLQAGCATPAPSAGGATTPAAALASSSSSSPSLQSTAPTRFAPPGPGALRYNDPIEEPPLDPFGRAVVDAVRAVGARAGIRSVAPDARLFAACAELAAILPPDGQLASELVEFAMQRHGIVEPSPNLIVVWGHVEAPQLAEELAARFAATLDGEPTLRFGVGRVARLADGTGAVVFAALASAIRTAPLPRALPPGGTVTLVATLDERFRDPEVVVTRDSGATLRVAVQRGAANQLTADVACGTRVGRQQIEVLATGPRGVKVLANFPVWCGSEPPRTFQVESTADDGPTADPRAAERRLLQLVNRDRAAAGLAPLPADERVAAVARAYSSEMQRTGVVAHVSPRSGAAVDRVRAAGLKTGLVLENIARTGAVGEAHRGLMDSPGHRDNILSPLATHVGIGVVLGERTAERPELFTTELFIRVPPLVEPVAARALIRQKIAAAKASARAGASDVGVHPQLTAIAQQFAEELAAGKPHAAVYAAASQKLDGLAALYGRVATTVNVTAELEAFDGAAILKTGIPDDLGIGLAQGVHAELGPGAIWLVVLSAQRR